MKRPEEFSSTGYRALFLLLTLLVLSVVVGGILLLRYLKTEETRRIALFASAMKYQQDSLSLTPSTLDLVLEISKSNNTIPIIVTDSLGKPLGKDLMKNIPREVQSNDRKIQRLLQRMKESYTPFEIQLPSGNQYVYYTHSNMLHNLRYAPYGIGLVVLLYLLFSFWLFQSLKKSDENRLWASLAKETAHQIGTPLSSLMGWQSLLLERYPEERGIREIGHDVDRLRMISERFSKIGSVPQLDDLNLSETLSLHYEYLRKRMPSKVKFTFQKPREPILLPHNRILMNWVIENLVNNSLDAMKGEGEIELSLTEKNAHAIIEVKDSGPGVSKSLQNQIFKAGFSTKKRGWGIGLSLAKRAVEHYHRGEIRILSGENQKGALVQISLGKSS